MLRKPATPARVLQQQQQQQATMLVCELLGSVMIHVLRPDVPAPLSRSDSRSSLATTVPYDEEEIALYGSDAVEANMADPNFVQEEVEHQIPCTDSSSSSVGLGTLAVNSGAVESASSNVALNLLVAAPSHILHSASAFLLDGSVCPFSSSSPSMNYLHLENLPLVTGTFSWTVVPVSLHTLILAGMPRVTGSTPSKSDATHHQGL
jgi:hypothetical protein